MKVESLGQPKGTRHQSTAASLSDVGRKKKLRRGERGENDTLEALENFL